VSYELHGTETAASPHRAQFGVAAKKKVAYGCSPAFPRSCQSKYVRSPILQRMHADLMLEPLASNVQIRLVNALPSRVFLPRVSRFI
jgi:hypothetical protein